MRYLKDKFLIDDFFADAGLKIGRLEETKEELVDQLQRSACSMTEKRKKSKKKRHTTRGCESENWYQMIANPSSSLSIKTFCLLCVWTVTRHDDCVDNYQLADQVPEFH